MKQSYIKNLILLLLILIGICKTEIFNAQCINVTLSTQAEVDAFICTGVSGNLTIEGPDINNLNQLFTAGLTSVGGDLIVRNCPLLTNLLNLDIIQTVGGKFLVENMPEITSLGGFEFQIQSCRELNFTNCPKLVFNFPMSFLTSVSFFLNLEGVNATQDLSGIFPNLSFAPNIRFFGNHGITQLPNFANLTSSASIVLSNNTIPNVSGFTALTSTVIYTDPVTNITWDGNIFVSNNGGFITISGFDNLTSLANGADLVVSNNFIVNNISGFSSLTSAENVFIIDNAVFDISGFENLTSINQLSITGNYTGGAFSGGGSFPIENISGFNNLQTIHGSLVINDNIETTTISGFNSLTSLGALSINDNPELNEMTGFANLTSTDFLLEVSGNSNLSECCWILDIASTTNSIFNNATGCNSLSEIGAGIPTLTGCPSNETIFTGSNNCEGIYNVNFPTTSDDCGVTYEAYAITYDGVLGSEIPSSSGASLSLTLQLGVNEIDFGAGDDSGNFGSCFVTITVQDNIAPEFTSDLPTDLTISTNGINCMAIYSVIFPNATDNCTVMNRSLYVYDQSNSFLTEYANDNPVEGATYTIDLLPGEYSVEAIIDDGVSSDFTFTSLFVEDNSAPVITSSFQDVTITCNETVPNGPTAGVDVFSTDACYGDLSFGISITSSSQSGTCLFDQAKEIITYTIESTDFDNNMASESYTVTIINNQQVSLGPDITLCGSTPEIITASGAQGTFMWSTGQNTQAISVTQAGTYSVTVTGTSGCCTIDEIDVSMEDLPNSSATGGLIGCSSPSVQIFGNSTTSGVSYSWTGPGGYSSNMQNPTVTSLGEYIVTVSTANGCTSTASAMVGADTDTPNVTLVGGTIDCTMSEVQLMASSTTTGVEYAWSGPGSFTSDIQNPTVTAAGTYSVTVTAENGCSISSNVDVVQDTDAPNLVFEADNLNCSNLQSIVSVSEFQGTFAFAWIGPDGFASSESTPTISSPGTYSVTVTGENTCMQTASLEISEDVQEPVVAAQGGEIDCSSNTITIISTSEDENLIYFWEGPGGFNSALMNPIVGQEGPYNLIVTAANGCTATTSVEITKDENIPSATAAGGTITCIETSIQLSGSSETNGVTFAWSGPENFTSAEQNPNVTEAGEYTLTVLADNGCSAIATANVEADLEIVEIGIEISDLNCEDNTNMLTASITGEFETLSWMGPDGFISSEQNPVVPGGGEYTISVVSANGCVASQTITSQQLDLPDAMATGNTLTCDLESVMISGSSSTTGATFMWTGPGSFTSTAASVQVSEIGTYIFTVTAENGCASSAEATVLADDNAPNVQVLGGNIDCNSSEVELMGSTTTTGATFLWTGPNGFTSTGSNPLISTAGTYTFAVTSDNGCVAKQTIVVEEDLNEPEIDIQIEEIDCEAGSLTLDASSEEIEFYAWTGPNDFASDQASVSISEIGDYSLMVTGKNGCTSIETYTQENTINYLAEITTTPDTSFAGGTAQIVITGGNAPYLIIWDNGINGASTSGLGMGEHSVVVTDSKGCTLTFTFMVDGPTNVFDLENEISISIYPNPVSEYLTVEWDSDSEVKAIQIYKLDGSKMYHNIVSNLMGKEIINVNEFNSGTYFIKITSETGIAIRKFVKM